MLNQQISHQLYESIAQADKPREYEHWHASAIAKCPREQYFLRKGIPPLEKPGAGKVLRWTAGHLIEEAIRPHIENIYKDVVSNQRLVSEKLDLTGEYDNLSGETLIEIKSVHLWAFKEKDGVLGLKLQNGNHTNGNKRWEISNSPYLHHELQNHAYALLLKEKGAKIERIDYIYISLDGRIVAYTTKPQEKIFNNVLKRLEVLNKAWKAQQPPECICDQKDHPLYNGVMQYCGYRNKETGECCSLDLLKEEQ